MRTIEASDTPTSEEFLTWLASHVANPQDVYRLDIRDDEAKMTVFQYERGTDGRIAYDVKLRDVVRREPFEVPILTPVPAS